MAEIGENVEGRVLVVNDNSLDLELVADILSENGYDPIVSQTAEYAFESIKKIPPDLILLGVEFPGMDGYELCRQLKSDPFSSHIPVVFILDLKDEKSKAKFFAFGGVDYISKPFNDFEILAKVSTHLSLSRMRQHFEEMLEEGSSKLDLAKERFKKFFDLATDAFYIHDFNGAIIDINEHACKSLSYTREEILELNIVDIETSLSPKDLHGLSERVENEEQVIAEGLHRRKDGSTFPVEVSLGLFDANEPKLVLAIARDISERKHADEMLRQYAHIVSSSTDLLALINKDYVYQAVNNEYLRRFNLSFENILGKSVSKMFGEDFFNTVLKPRIDRCLLGEVVNYQEWFEFLEDGRCYIDITYFPYTDDQNEIQGYVVNARDITERRATEQMLEASEKRYRELYENSPLGYQSLDAEGRFVEANPTLCWMLGYERGELKGKWFGDILTPESTERFKTNFPKFKAKGVVHSVPFDMLDKNGNVFSVEIDGVIGRDDKGNFKQTHCVIQNVSDRKEAELALRESEERFRKMFDNAAFGIVICRLLRDKTGNLVDFEHLQVNRANLKHTGVKPDALIGKRASEIVSLKEVEELLRIYGQVVETGNPDQYERYFSIYDRTLDVAAFPISGDLFALTFIDISDRKRAEERIEKQQYYLEKAQELGRIGTWELDILHDKLIWTDENYRIFGIPIGDKLNFEVFISCVHPDDRDFVNAKWRAGLEGATYDIEHRLLVDGKVKWVREKGEIIYDVNSKPVRAIGFTHEITERKQAERELQKMEKLRSLGTLAGGIAHDFNNILTGIFSNILLAKETLTGDHSGFKLLKESEKSMDRAIRLTNQLLTFAKGGEPVKENVSLDDLVQETVRFDLSGSNVKPVFEFSKGLWNANVDKGQIQQVFSNLAINADHAMPDGGELHIKLENAELSDNDALKLKSGRYIILTVMDHGTGIDRKHLDRIFDPYFTTKQSGSGLGLATVYSIVTRHGGHINVDSKLGEGTTFTLHLPASELRLRSEPQKAQGVDRVKTESKARVLVMDDEQIILDSISLILRNSGYMVDTALDGERAIEIFKQSLEDKKPFEAIIMDLTIPGGLGGKEVVKSLLAIDPKVKCIVSSGYANDPIMANYKEYGFKGVIAKPYTLDSLRKVLRKVLNE